MVAVCCDRRPDRLPDRCYCLPDLTSFYKDFPPTHRYYRVFQETGMPKAIVPVLRLQRMKDVFGLQPIIQRYAYLMQLLT